MRKATLIHVLRRTSLSYVRGMRFHLFSPLLKGPAQAKNSVPGIFGFFLTQQTYKNSNALLNQRLVLVLK